MSYLLTGGTGLLGKELQKHMKFYAPSHEEMDICHRVPQKFFDMVVHSAAYTDTTKAETDRRTCFTTNVFGTLNLLDAFPDTPFVFISSEYAHNPVNFYSLTKSLAEQLVTTHPNYLIIRTLFKPYPYPYKKAFKNQVTLGGYITDVAPLIVEEIQKWDGESKLIYVGDGRGEKTLYELAKETKPDVEPNTTTEWSKITGIKYPTNYK